MLGVRWAGVQKGWGGVGPQELGSTCGMLHVLHCEAGGSVAIDCASGALLHSSGSFLHAFLHVFGRDAAANAAGVC